MPRSSCWFPLLTLLVLASGCRVRGHGCLGGDDGKCLPPPACPARPSLAGCAGSTLRWGVVDRALATSMRTRSPKAAAGEGDYFLENDVIRVVIDAVDKPRGLAPSGGTIIDLSLVGAAAGDHLNAIFQGAGLLPRDAVRYDRLQIVDGVGFVALVARGHLAGDDRVDVVTRYEVRPCEPGVRVRTVLANGSSEVNTFFLADGHFWGDRALLPFVPIVGGGFRHPELDLLELSEAWRRWPFLAARSQAEPHVGYASIPCDRASAAGFNDPTLSGAGVPLVPTLPGDALAFERFIAVAPGPGLGPAVGEALRARAEFFGEPKPAIVRGRVAAGGMPLDPQAGRAASLLFYEPAAGADPDAEGGRRPWSEVVPGRDGRFELALPPGRAFRVQPHAFGRPAGAGTPFTTGAPEAITDVGEVRVERPARLTVTVAGAEGESVRFAELVLTPVDAPSGPAPSLYGLFGGCQPMLGPAHGGSPACNRVLALDGKAQFLAPAGRYFVYVTRGPFATLAREDVTLAAGDDRAITLRSTRLPLLPPGVLSADFHVHGGASFDASIPDADRAATFMAAGVEVIAATDHDVVTSYAAALEALGARDQVVVMPGVESTPNILWFDVKGERFPKTLGHFNFWPLAHAPTAARGGAPWDEEREPAALMDAVEELWAAPGVGVRQMNHPWSRPKLGRDEGLLRALGYDPRKPVAPKASFAADVLLRGAPGGRRNIDFDAQEVITGPSRREFVRNRALWFSFLSQGLLKAGTANSDSHGLGDAPLGYGRTLVLGGMHSVAAFDVARFNADVRTGRLVGTNGPALHVRVVDAAGKESRPALEPLAAGRDATLVVDVAAAPWIPVTEVRFVVNGRVVKTQPVPLADAADPFGLDRHHQVKVSVGELVTGVARDAWLVVEAGLPLPPVADLDDDGVPETGDANGDGKADAADVPKGDDDDDEDLRFPDPGRPANMDARFHLHTIAPGVWPYAFTNPFLLDLDGGGWTAPGL